MSSGGGPCSDRAARAHTDDARRGTSRRSPLCPTERAWCLRADTAGSWVWYTASDSPPLRRPATVVGNRGHVLDRLDLKPRGGKRLDRRLTAAARALHTHVHAANTEGQRLARGLLRGNGRGKRRRLLRSLEAGLSGRAPGDRVAMRVRDRDRRVVECGADVGDAFRLDHALGLLSSRHRLLRDLL